MAFSVACECGISVPVEAWSAGTTVDCTCGREVEVPSLQQLRDQARVPRPDAPPEYRVLKMIERGELPGHTCVQCGCADSPAVSLLAVCEEVRSSAVSEFDEWLRAIAGVLLFFTCGLWIALLAGRLFSKNSAYGDWNGEGTAVLMPTALCPGCRPMFGFGPIGYLLAATAWLLLIGSAVAVLSGSQSILAACLAGASSTAFGMAAVVRRQRQRTWKELLRKTPVYSEVLTRFPKARIDHIPD